MRSTTVTLLATAISAVAVNYAVAAAPANFQEDFSTQGAVGSAMTSTAGLTASQGPSHIIVQQDPNPKIDKYINWDPTADSHVLVTNSNNPDLNPDLGFKDYQFSLRFAMTATVGINSGWNQCLQWTYIPALDGTRQTSPQFVMIGRNSVGGGVGIGAGTNLNVNGRNLLSQIPNIPMSPGSGSGPVMSVAADMANWAYIRVQKLGTVIRVKGWGLNMPEPTWEEAFANNWATQGVLEGTNNGQADTYQGFNTTENGGEAGLRFKWSAGMSIDNVSYKTILPGDADGSGDVSGVDVGIWATNFTGTLPKGTGGKLWTEGDWNYDGCVDGVDVGIWATNFTGTLAGDSPVVAPGASPEAVAMLQSMGITVVPEPATLGLLGLGALGLLARRRH